jgi:hypothetical protein
LIGSRLNASKYIEKTRSPDRFAHGAVCRGAALTFGQIAILFQALKRQCRDGSDGANGHGKPAGQPVQRKNEGEPTCNPMKTNKKKGYQNKSLFA